MNSKDKQSEAVKDEQPTAITVSVPLEIEPFQVPNYVYIESYGGVALVRDDVTDRVKIPVSSLSAETRLALCARFQEAIMAK
jgi:hypothetical protein